MTKQRLEPRPPWLPWWLSGKESAHNAETWLLSLGQEDPLEEEMATRSNILAWEIPCTEDPGGLQSMRLQKVRHDLATNQQQQFWLNGSLHAPCYPLCA